MEKITNVMISFWFKELDFNPKEKVLDLEKELHSLLDTPFMYNEQSIESFISMPRIQAMSQDKKYLFQMSLINANLSINVHDLDKDEIILLINNNIQLVYDVLKNLYNLEYFYTSIKIEIVEECPDASNSLAHHSHFKGEYEDFSLKRGFVKDNYYINYLLNSGREYNFDISRKEGNIEQDIFDRTLISSLSKARLNKEFIMKIVEINDRLAYNKDSSYESNKDSIRGMIMELKNILNKQLYDKI